MDTSKATFFFCNKKVDWLKPAFEELKKVIDKYVEWEGIPPYWESENASTSMLSAAAARAGYIVLSLYS